MEPGGIEPPTRITSYNVCYTKLLRAESFQLNAGGHVSVVVNRDWGVLIPHLRVDWVHELEDSAEQVNVQLANDPFALA